MTLGEYLSSKGLTQLRIAETQKYAHVTFFFNGGEEKTFEGEDRILIKSPDVPTFDLQPEMSAYPVCDAVCEQIRSGKYDVVILNFANCDMVGHTGSLDSTIIGVEAVDLGLSRLIKVCDEYGVTLVVTADHGNADEMLEKNKKGEIQVRTAHSLNPVPFIIYDKDTKYTIKDGNYGLANVAPTVVKMLGLTAPDCWQESMI